MKNEMTFNEYQKMALETAIYGKENALSYVLLGLSGEVGELCNKYKKTLRDDDGVLTLDKQKDLLKELGDVLWYVAALADELDADLGVIAQHNISKLYDRQSRGVIGGSGDAR
jgi:NTP pyrophosphatase (non-canonical NTP hydrolase)